MLVITAIIGTAIFFVPVSAQITPCPIALSIKTIPESTNVGLHVVLKNLAGEAVMQTVTNELGDADFELGGIAACTNYQASILECDSSPVCNKIVAFNPTGPIIWDITSAPIEVPVITTVAPPTTTVTSTITTTITVPPECQICPEPTKPEYDWSTFITGGGLAAFLYWLVKKYVPYKDKIKIEKRVGRDGKPYTVIMKWSEYTRKDGTTGHKWILVQTIKNEV